MALPTKIKICSYEPLIYLLKFLVFLVWMAGIVIAKGFWSTFFAIFFAPYSFYLVVEKLLLFWGII